MLTLNQLVICKQYNHVTCKVDEIVGRVQTIIQDVEQGTLYKIKLNNNDIITCLECNVGKTVSII